MASPVTTNEKPLVAGETKYTNSDNYSAEHIQPEVKLKRQLKNRHVAMIRLVISSSLLTSSRPFDASVLAVL
jgi:amino acid permease